MPIATYRQFFETALEELIERGGAPFNVIRLVQVYRGEDDGVRDAAFRDWVAETPFVCGRCNRFFEADAGRVGEDNYVLCPPCGPQLA
jgi:hypothetical protein